jgi:membrane-bound ClpP family serine protease
MSATASVMEVAAGAATAAGTATAAGVANALTSATSTGDLLLPALLMCGGIILTIAECFVISFGLLAIGALLCAIASVLLAWDISPAYGFSMLVIAPIAGVVAVRIGLERMRRSPAVPQSEITAQVGQQAHAVTAGATVGATGVLLTDAYPTGRARFASGDIDVQVRAGHLTKGTAVAVVAIDGPVILIASTSR